MGISYDSAKNQRNIELRGLSFDSVAIFDFETSLTRQDDIRRAYAETRYVSIGTIGARLHVVVCTPNA